MSNEATLLAILGAAVLLLTASESASAQAASTSKAQVRRGEYLINYGGCNDCHTPKTMTPNGPVPDTARLLSGHPAEAKVPPVPVGALGPNQWGAMTNNDLTA